MKKDIVEIYKECGNFHQAVKESGLPIFVAHIRLLKSGVLKIQDKIKHGNAATKLGAEAEELFQKLIPEAIDANKYWCKNNPVYDFMYKNMTIDVKFSSYYKGGKEKRSPYWSFKCTGNPNLFVVFLENDKNIDKENKLKDPYILLIPNGFTDVNKKIHITKGNTFFTDFQVAKENLKMYLDEYAGVFG